MKKKIILVSLILAMLVLVVQPICLAIEENEQEAMSKTLLQLTTYVEAENQGRMMYDSYEFYKTSKSGIDVYKIKYTTSSSWWLDLICSRYYYQLVSFKNHYTEIDRTTNLYSFGKYWFFFEAGDTQEMEYAYKTTFDNYYEEMQNLYE